DSFLVDRLARLLVEAAIVDRTATGRGARVLYDEDQAAGLGMQLLLAVRVAVPQHGPGATEPFADLELALEDVPDLCKVMAMPWVPCAWFQSQQAGVRRSGVLGRRMREHLSGFARPANRFPFNLVDMANLRRRILGGVRRSDWLCPRTDSGHCKLLANGFVTPPWTRPRAACASRH